MIARLYRPRAAAPGRRRQRGPALPSPAWTSACCGAQVPFVRGGAEALHGQPRRRARRRRAPRRAGAAPDRLGPRTHLRRRARLADGADRRRPRHRDQLPVVLRRSTRDKVVWLAHQHRGAYDGAGGPWSDFGTRRREPRAAAPAHGVGHAGAVRGRAPVHDRPGVVADRLARYNGLAAEPLYHPPPLFDRLHPGRSATTCSARCDSRATSARAWSSTRSPTCGAGTRLVLAGRGSLADELDAERRRVGRRATGSTSSAS